MPDAVDVARARLVADLVREGRVRSAAVADAITDVPRHLFLPDLDPEDAYADDAVPIKIEDGVTLSSVSQPSMVAIMLEQLATEPGHRVLEIGAGGGWNAGLLAHLVGPGGAVVTLDIDDDLVRRTRDGLAAAGITGVEAHTADGALGYPPGAPYDRIELTVGATDIRPEWVEQLRPGGRLVLPLAVRGSQLSIAFDLTATGRLESVSVRSCAFVRLRGAGADDAAAVALSVPGWSVLRYERATVPLDVLDHALARPGRVVVDSPDRCAVPDVWDGLGLWCALADPDVFRLLVDGPSADAGIGRSLVEGGSGRVAVGLAVDGGAALLLGDPSHAIRGFGDAGRTAARRLAGLVGAWVDAGRPHAADLRIEATPAALPPAPPAESDGAPGLDSCVDLPHARLRVRMP
jgi:protein-L-isoaspartate(D-aspartate) O-methyltransferase